MASFSSYLKSSGAINAIVPSQKISNFNDELSMVKCAGLWGSVSGAVRLGGAAIKALKPANTINTLHSAGAGWEAARKTLGGNDLLKNTYSSFMNGMKKTKSGSTVGTALKNGFNSIDRGGKNWAEFVGDNIGGTYNTLTKSGVDFLTNFNKTKFKLDNPNIGWKRASKVASGTLGAATIVGGAGLYGAAKANAIPLEAAHQLGY